MKEIIIEEKASATKTITVTKSLTAKEMGSGSLEVFATPAMVALMEAAAVKALSPFLEKEETSLGVFLQTSHLAPTAVGKEVYATAQLVSVSGKKVEFIVKCFYKETLLGEGRHTRVVVDRERFLQKI